VAKQIIDDLNKEFSEKIANDSMQGIIIISFIIMIITLPFSFATGDKILQYYHIVYIVLLLFNYVIFQKTKNLIASSTLVLGPAFFLLLYGLLKGLDYALTWIYIFPLLTYFFTGKYYGTIINIVFNISVGIILYVKLHSKSNGITDLLVILSSFISITAISYLLEANRQKIHHRLKVTSMLDYLTRAWNRKKFDEDLKNEIAKVKRYGDEFSLIIFDIDNFKLLNDNYGHAIGDAILKEITVIQKEKLRTMDTFYRIGGEEFAIILPETNIVGAFAIADRLRQNVEEYSFANLIKITISAGAGGFCSNCNYEEVLLKVDKALYRAKEKGKNRVESANI